MQEETFKSRLDIYYLAMIAYFVTLIAYVIVRGTLIGDKFEVVWQDPIVYLLAICGLIALAALIGAAVLNRAVIVGEKELRFRSRFKVRVITPADIAWISFRRERRLRGQGPMYPTARIRVHGRRRSLRLRPGSFERSGHLARALRDFARHNGIELHVGWRRRRNREQ